METTMEFVSTGPEMTRRFGAGLAGKARPGQVFALDGDLGAGKTVFAQGFAAGLGIEDYVNSPTFTILQVYEGGRLKLYHFDVYRIEDPEEMYEIGADTFFYGDGVCLVEWASQIEDLLPGDTVYVQIAKMPEKGYDCRKITVRGMQP